MIERVIGALTAGALCTTAFGCTMPTSDEAMERRGIVLAERARDESATTSAVADTSGAKQKAQVGFHEWSPPQDPAHHLSPNTNCMGRDGKTICCMVLRGALPHLCRQLRPLFDRVLTALGRGARRPASVPDEGTRSPRAGWWTAGTRVADPLREMLRPTVHPRASAGPTNDSGTSCRPGKP